MPATSAQISTRKCAASVILLIGSIACGLSATSATAPGAYHGPPAATYITAIEDRTTAPHGFMVMTEDYTYAIISPRLALLGWHSITVNGAQVFIVTLDQSTLTSGLFAMSEHERDAVAEIRADFLQQLAGLRLAQPAAAAPLTAKQAYDSARVAGGESSHAAAAIALLRELVADRGYTHREYSHEDEAAGDESQPQGELPLLPAEKKRKLAELLGEPAAKSNATEPSRRRSYGPQVVGYAGGQAPPRLPLSYAPQSAPPVPDHSHCLRKDSAHFNYHNLRGSPAEKSIIGDIYNLDLRCNILDLYSASVSVLRQPGVSILYRDEQYFAYASSNMPLQINRFFLIGDAVFLVYNDASLLLKPSWLLEPLELDLVVSARRRLRSITRFRSEPLAGRSAPAESSAGSDQSDESARSDKPSDGHDDEDAVDGSSGHDQAAQDKQ